MGLPGRFWEWIQGSFDTHPIMGLCGQSQGSVRLYKVENAALSGTHYFTIYDCGTSSWASCNALSLGPDVSDFGTQVSGVSTETQFGKNCNDTQTGTSGNPVVFGGPLGDVEGMIIFNGSYSVRSLDFAAPSCSHYAWGVHSDQKMSTYDDRN